MEYRQLNHVSIYNADFIKLSIAEGIVDLIVTSPPYNISIAYGQYQDATSYQDYPAFSHRWLRGAFRALRPDGRLCLNIALDKRALGNS